MSLSGLLHPGTVLLVVALGSLVPVSTTLDLFAVHGESAQPSRAYYDIAFICSVVLAAWAVHRVGAQSWWSSRLSPTERWCFHLAMLSTLIVLPTWALHALQGPMGTQAGTGVGPTWPSVLRGALHATSLALVLLRWRLPSGMRPVVLLALAWLLPALLADSPLLALTSVSIPEAAGLSTRMAPSGIDFAPILALLLAAWLLEHRPVPRP
jgi:hypothetical protein